MAPKTTPTRNLFCLLALFCFVNLSALPVYGDPGTPFTLTVKKSETEPLAGVNCYVFSGGGSYLGKAGATNSSGDVTFDLADGSYKFRIDYLGYQFWSQIYSVPTSVSGVLTIPHEEVVIGVEGLNQGSPYPMQGLKVYLFTGSGSYMGQSRVTDSNGEAVFNLPEKSYKARVDYLGRQYWSEVFQWQDETVTISMGNAEITVTGSGLPLPGVNVYVFSPAGAYLGVHGTTDSSGKAVFTLPAGSYKYRADYQASQFWSSEEPIVGGQTNPVAISTGGGSFSLTVQRGASDPLAGVNCYLFNEAGTYLGISRTTDSGGLVSVNLSNGTYKFRVDYLGYQFWSDVYSVPASLSGALTIQHQDVTVRVDGLNQGSPYPMQGLSVYLFTASGSYLGQSLVTNSSGEVIFNLPESAYKIRADYLGQQFWSEPFTWQDKTVTVPMGNAEITVTGSGLPLPGVNVYVFSEAGAYLGISSSTDSSGKVVFSLPAGSYKYRADYQSSQYWSGVESLIAGQINPVTVSTGGGAFALTIQKGPAAPISGVNCYVFSGAGSYLGMSGASNSTGGVSFNLSNGSYKFRADHLGYQFWSDIFSVPASLSGTLTIPHQDVVISVQGVNQGSSPMAGVPVYLFTASGAYLGQSQLTDGNGQVTFHLPDQAYKVRADYLGQHYWSEVFQWQNATVSIPMGDAEVTVTGSGLPLPGVNVYVFSAAGAYLGVSGTTNGSGKAFFTLPGGTYDFRADYQGGQYWSGASGIVAGQVNSVTIVTLPGTIQVPDVVGLSQMDAGATITAAGLTVGTTSHQYSATVAEGLVISQNPAAGTSVAGGSLVDLVVSLGSAPMPTASITATPQTIHAGESANLSWTSTNAESCFIEPGIGSVAPSGSLQVTPEATTTYVITAVGPGGTATDSATVAVTSIPYGRDDDGDELPDWWELAYFPDLSQGRNGDHDGDGFSNYLEYVFNTDPGNQNEVPPSSDSYQDAGLGYAPEEQQGGAGLVAGSIRITNGNAMEFREDLSFPSPNSLGFTFRAAYNSRATQTGMLGYGWFHSFGAALNPSSQLGSRTFLKIIDGTGHASYFVMEGGGYYNGVFGERSYVLAEGGGYSWYRLDGSRYAFTSAGRLSSMEDEKGNALALAYDGQGRLQTVTDNASGRVLTFNYTSGLLASITGPVTAAVDDGIWVEYGYDGNQNLTTVTYADGSGITYVYNDANDVHNLTQKKDSLNHILREWSYNTNDQATVCRSPDGKGVELVTYQPNQVQLKDVYDITRTYALVTVDGLKRLGSMTGITNAPYAESNAVEWVYDEWGRLSEVEYGEGRIDRYQNYDERGNPGTVILAYGSPEQRTIYYTFHPDMNVPLTRTEASVLGGGNKVTIWDYDVDYDATANESPTLLLSRMVEQGHTKDINNTTQTYAYVTTFTYNAKGQVLSVDGPRSGTGDTTTFTYNSSTGNLESVTQPHIGSTYFAVYDNAGRPGTITDVNSQAKGFSYDGRGRITSITNFADDPDSSTQFAHVGGLLDSVTDPDGVTQGFQYDNYARLWKILDQGANYIRHDYEAYPRGNLVERGKYTSSEERKSRMRWSYEHPSYPGKLYREIQSDDSFREYGYDDAGNVSSMEDPNGNLTTYGYDFMDRLLEVAQWVNDPNLRDVVTGYGYDGQGNLASVTDANAHATTYVYDDMGRVVSTTSPDTGITRYAYDEAGNLRFRKDAKAVTVEYTYDNLNRVTLADYPGTTDDVGYTYDLRTNGKGRLTDMSDPSGTIAFGYDARGRLVQKTSTINSVSYPVTSAYGPGGRVASVTYPSGRVVTNTRDSQLGKTASVSTSGFGNLVSGLTYNPFGGPKGLTNAFGGTVNNQAGECDCVTVSNPGQPRERTYGYDANRNLTSITGTTTPWYSQTFGYDELNRLTSATGRYGSIAYTYDDVGNRITRNTNGVVENYTYYAGTNSLYQVTGGQNPRAFTYDANGNPTSDGTLTFIYDQSNQLKEIKQGQTSIAAYTYNGLGQRVKKTVVGGATTVYHYDLDGKLIAESTLAGTFTKEYLYMGKVRVAMVDVAGGGAIYHFLNDRLGTPEILTNATGTVAWEAWYEPFGEAHIHPSSSVVNNIRLPGQYYDAETGLHINGFRYYDPRTGRFLTPDPIGQAGGINLYPYVQNNPVNRTDPLGLWYIDINISGGYWLGATGGILISPSGVYPYVGGGLVTPGVGGSVTWSPSDPTKGWNIGLQGQGGLAGQVGYGFGKGGGWFWEIGVGGGYPTLFGGSLTGYYVFGPYQEGGKDPYQERITDPCE